MRSPFEKHMIKLEVSLNDLIMLYGIIRSCIPDIKNEQAIVDLSIQVQAKIEELKNAS